MNRYQITKVGTGDDVFETCDIIEAVQEIALIKRELEETGYTNAQIVFRVLDDYGLEKLAEVHRLADKHWDSLLVTQGSQAFDALEKAIGFSKGSSDEATLTKEKIYYDAKFGHKGLSYRLSTSTFLACDKVVTTTYYAEFGEDKLEISKREYEFLLKALGEE